MRKLQWDVQSASQPGVYYHITFDPALTDPSAWTCTCPDYKFRSTRCKHILGVKVSNLRGLPTRELTEVRTATVCNVPMSEVGSMMIKFDQIFANLRFEYDSTTYTLTVTGDLR